MRKIVLVPLVSPATMVILALIALLPISSFVTIAAIKSNVVHGLAITHHNIMRMPSPSPLVLSQKNIHFSHCKSSQSFTVLYFSSSTPSTAAGVSDTDKNNINEEDDSTTENWNKKAENIERNGPDDMIISVHVGGEEFKTLKSTLQICPRLWDALERAEKRESFDTIFIDRDPKHFPTILTYLRNKADGITYDHKNPTRESDNSDDKTNNHRNKVEVAKENLEETYFKHVRLPTSVPANSSNTLADELEDLHVEAKYYDLPELLWHLEGSHFLISVVNFLRAGGRGNTNEPKCPTHNPFDEIKQIYATVRNGSLFLAGTGTAIGSIDNISVADLLNIKNSILSFMIK